MHLLYHVWYHWLLLEVRECLFSRIFQCHDYVVRYGYWPAEHSHVGALVSFMRSVFTLQESFLIRVVRVSALLNWHTESQWHSNLPFAFFSCQTWSALHKATAIWYVQTVCGQIRTKTIFLQLVLILTKSSQARNSREPVHGNPTICLFLYGTRINSVWKTWF